MGASSVSEKRLRETSQVSNPPGQLISLRENGPPSTDHKPKIEFLPGQTLKWDQGEARDLQTDLDWQETSAGAGLQARSAASQLGQEETLPEPGGAGLARSCTPPPKADSLRSVDPDDVQVAIVDALLVLVGKARAAPGTVVLLGAQPSCLLLPRLPGTLCCC